MVKSIFLQISTKHQIDVPASTSHYPQSPYPPTVYDYLALAPGLLVAITPLVLGWLDRRNKDEDKED